VQEITSIISNPLRLKDQLRRFEYPVYCWLSYGIVYSMLFWPLLNSLCIISLFLFWLLIPKKTWPQSLERKLILISFLSLYLTYLVGILYTVNFTEGTFRLQQKLPLLIFPLVYGTSNILDKKMFRKISTHFLIATTLACLISVVVKGIKLIANHGNVADDSSNLFIFRDSYPYMIGLFCLMSILIAFELIKNSISKRRILLITVILFLSTFLLLLSIRLVIAAWAVMLIIKTYRLLTNKALRILIAAAIVITIVAAIRFIPRLNTQWTELTTLHNNYIPLDTDSSQGRSWGGGAIRIAIWQSSKELAARHWPIGLGTGDVQDSLQQAYRDHQFYFASEYNRYNAHNQYLQMLLGHGVPGLLSLLCCILLPIIFIKQMTVRADYLIFLVLFAFVCCTETILDINKGIVWFSFFNSIFAFIKPNPKLPK